MECRFLIMCQRFLTPSTLRYVFRGMVHLKFQNLSRSLTMTLHILASLFNCEAGRLPFNFLSWPLGANMDLVKHWKLIEDRFRRKLSNWKAHTLSSFGRRLTLIKSVLGTLPLLFFSMFKVPKTVINKLEQFRNNNLWYGDDQSLGILE